MLRIGVLMVLAVELGAGFGSASATVLSSSGDSVNIDLEVEVETSATAVVAHLVAPGEPQLILPLLHRGSGHFGIQTDLAPIDYQVVFEAIGDPSVQSLPVSLSALGAEFPSDSPNTPSTDSDGLGAGTRQWGWLGLGLAAASLSALAFWALGGRDSEGSDESGADEEE